MVAFDDASRAEFRIFVAALQGRRVGPVRSANKSTLSEVAKAALDMSACFKRKVVLSRFPRPSPHPVDSSPD